MVELLENVAAFLAKQLDKLKVSNPIVFVLVQGVLVTLSGLFATDGINLATPESLLGILNFLGITDIDSAITGVLVSLLALVGTRTTSFIKK
jgi:hypothetical protein